MKRVDKVSELIVPTEKNTYLQFSRCPRYVRSLQSIFPLNIQETLKDIYICEQVCDTNISACPMVSPHLEHDAVLTNFWFHLFVLSFINFVNDNFQPIFIMNVIYYKVPYLWIKKSLNRLFSLLRSYGYNKEASGWESLSLPITLHCLWVRRDMKQMQRLSHWPSIFAWTYRNDTRL